MRATTPRPSTHRATGSRRVPTLPALLTAIILVAACAGPTPSPQGPTTTSSGPFASPAAAAASGEPAAPGTSARPGAPTPAPTVTPDPKAWAHLALATVPAVATLVPTKSSRGSVAADTAFKLTSLDGRPPAELAALLVTDPPITFRVASTAGRTAILRPATKLRPGTLYRMSLTRPDGSTQATWAAQAASPLAVVETIPGYEATGVPVRTGIEIVFNQGGVTAADLKKHFSIKPATAGRFEASGRSVVFVPSKPLVKGRVYTVTVRKGLPLAGTGQVLEADATVRFETAAKARSDVSVHLSHAFLEANPREKAAFSIWIDVPEGKKAPKAIPVTVHRLPGLEAAIGAWRTTATAPGFAQVSTVPVVPTAGLTRVVKADLKVQHIDESSTWLQLPRRLAAGWYLVTETWAGVPRQAVLQVTDLATFSMLGTDRSAVWVNNLSTTRAVPGASVSIDGRRLGATDERGLLVATTPKSLKLGEDEASSPVLVVRHGSQSAFQPFGEGRYCKGCASPSTDDKWWQLFTSDRSRFRSTDTINAWGVVRNRDTGKVPSSVTVTMRSDAGSITDPPIATARAVPNAHGTFSVSVPFKDIPVGDYRLLLTVGKEQVGELWLQVATIVKPAYRIEMTTDRHAVIDGDSVVASVEASFFEGTPVAGTEVGLSSGAVNSHRAVTTDADGKASGPVPVRLGSSDEQWTVTGVGAIPTLPEEARIGTWSDVAVFRATALVDASAALSGKRLDIGGKVSDVVLERFETVPPARLWEVDPRGAGRPAAAVEVRVIQHTPVRRQAGTRYNFITKLVEPVYDVTDRKDVVAHQTVQTGTDGTFRLALTVAGGDRSYEVFATYVDEGRRSVKATAYAENPQLRSDGHYTRLVTADPGHEQDEDPSQGTYSVGEEIRVQFTGGIEKTPVSRYFYAVTQGGLRYATVGASATFRRTFTAEAVPSVQISGVRFTGYGYEVAVSSYRARLRLDDRRLSVTVTPDKARYAPGETATVSIRTLGTNGQPVAASVHLQAIDEKLYAIGAAEQLDPIEALYHDVGEGLIGWAASHRTPADDYGDGKGGADTTGGGGDDRGDFRDWLIATLVTTGSDGRASVRVPLSDDLTSWHVGAVAVDAGLDAGSGTALLAVGLPFFAEASIAPEYLVADRPIIRVRGFGSDLAAGERVTFTVTSDTLPMSGLTVTADAFKAAEVPLPPLSAGTHRVRISATAGSGSTLRSDTLVRTFDVVPTRTSRFETTWAALDGPVDVKAGSGLTRITLVDAGRGRVVPILHDLAWTDGGRSDRVVAAALANRVLVEDFGLEAVTEIRETDLARFWYDAGLAIVPWGSANLDVTALAAMAGDPRLDAGRLAPWLWEAKDNRERARADRLLALAGLAGLGQPVLDEVREAAALHGLTIAEQINVALAALYAGDETLARSIEQDVLAKHGLRLGPWVRLDPGADEDASLQTARLAIVAASLGDPVAASMDAWVAANPPKTTTVALERVLAARGWANRVPGSSAVAAVTVDGERQQLTIKPDDPASVVLTPAQAATARLEPVSGSVLAITSWDGALDPASLTPARGQTLERTVRPGGEIGPADTVIVTLHVNLGPDARNECWRVTDLVPSGLAPISVDSQWENQGSDTPVFSRSPDFVDGQRVEFCVGGTEGTAELRYVARIVTPGTYLWEPAVLQSEIVPDQGVVTDPVTVTIKGTGN